MKYGKICIEENHLIFTKRMLMNRLPCEDILWAYRRVEETGGDTAYSVVVRTRRGKSYKFDMAEKEARLCLQELKKCNPWMAMGFPKGGRLPLQSLPNTRDLGALKAQDGRQILPYRLLRSGELYHVSSEDVRLLKEEYRLRTILDFRTEAERIRKPDTQIEGVCYLENPILDEALMGITWEEDVLKRLEDFRGNVEKYMEKVYRALILDTYSTSQYAKFFQYLLKQEEGAILWHCTAGKDRVGVGTALLLHVLGIPRDAIFEDYLRTNQYLEQETEYLLQLLESRLPKGYGVEESIRLLMRVEESYLAGVFRSIDESCGSMENFLKKKICLPPKAQEALRNKYLV